MTTATAPSIFSLPPAEKRAAYDEALERCDAERQIATAEYKARKAAAPDPHRDHYLTWKMQGMVCVLVVKHHAGEKSISVSRDGGGGLLVRLPNSASEVLKPESGDEFLLVLIPSWYAPWLAKKDYGAARRVRELFGVTLPLSAARPWTDAQVAAWKRLDKRRDSINWRIQAARTAPRRRQSNFTRNDVA